MKKEKEKAEIVNTFNQQTDKIEFIDKLRNSTKAIECPCCGRRAKFYNRKLNVKLCLALIHIVKYYRHHPSRPIGLFRLHRIIQYAPAVKGGFPKTSILGFDRSQGSNEKEKREGSVRERNANVQNQRERDKIRTKRGCSSPNRSCVQ